MALLSRTCFGPRNKGETEEYLRLSFATSEERICTGLERMASALAEL